MKKIIFILLLIFSNSCFSQDFSSIETIVNNNIGNYKNNVVVWIKQNNQTIYKLEKGSIDTVSEQLIASCTKWLTGAVMLSLVDEGLISLDDSIGKYLPIFTTYKKGSATIRQCMAHTSGFPAQSPQEFERNNSLSLAQAVDSIARYVSPLFSPGEKFNYGAVSMHICGRIAEISTGKSWAILFKERIATPCQMNNTYYFPLSNPLIAGGGYSSPKDYMNFLQMILNEGMFDSKQVIRTDLINEFFKDQTENAEIYYSPIVINPFFIADTIRYGIGNWLDELQVQSSSPGLFGTYPWVDKCRNLTGIIFTFSSLDSVYTSNIGIINEVRTQIPNCIIKSVQSNDFQSLINIYPNPSQNILQLKTNHKQLNNLIIRIFNNNGNIVLEVKYKNKIDISSLKSGQYYLKIEDEIVKFIKE